MEIKQKRSKFLVESNGKEYTVDLAKETCSCPHFSYRLRGSGEHCKHIKAVQDHLSLRRRSLDELKENKYERIIAFVKQDGPTDAVALIERWGEEEVNFLLFRGDLLENKGKIRAMS